MTDQKYLYDVVLPDGKFCNVFNLYLRVVHKEHVVNQINYVVKNGVYVNIGTGRL